MSEKLQQGFIEELKKHRSDSGYLTEDLKAIKEGFEKFEREVIGEYPKLYSCKSAPKFLVFACSDSRLFPSDIIFKPGNAFMVRNIANMVPAFNQLRDSGVQAAIKYAVKTLEVRNILIIGHSDLPADVSPPADNSKGNSPNEKCKHCTQEEVSLSLTNLRTYPDVLEKKELQLLGGYFDLKEKTFVVRKQIKPLEQEAEKYSIKFPKAAAS